MRVPHDAAIFHGWSYQTLIDFTSDRRCGSTREITMYILTPLDLARSV